MTHPGHDLGPRGPLDEAPGAVVIGGANTDVKARSAAPATPRTSNPGQVSMVPGGVGRNIAENLARLGTRTHLVSAVGRDPLGDLLLTQTMAAGVLTEHVLRTEAPTGAYAAVLDSDGELLVAVAAMAAMAELGPAEIERAREAIAGAGLVVVDGNLRLDTLEHALSLAAAAGVRAIVEPVSVPKARALSPYLRADRPSYAVTPNRDELRALTDLPTRTDREVEDAAAALHDRGVELVWVRLGERGSVLSRAGARPVALPAARTHAADTADTADAADASGVTDVTGAGDAGLAAFCHALLAGDDPESAARFGHAAAALTIASTHTVRPDLTERLVRSVLTSPAQERP